MPFRPSRTVRWAYDAASGALVEPPSGQQESGWDTGDRPAAQHFNYLFNVYGAWVDFLRSASLANWRAITIPFDTDVIQLGHFAPTIDADTSTTETTSPVRRLVIAAEDGGGACVFVSHRGDTWTRRNNFPSFTGYFRKVVYVPTSPTGRWFLLVDDASGGTLLHTNANSAVLANTGNWTAATLPGGTTGLRGLAYEATGGAHVLVSSDAIIASTNGTTWADATIASSPTGNFVDIAWTGTAFVAVTDDGETFTAGGGSSATGSWATATALPPGAGEWRLSVGAEGILIAWRYNTGSTLSFYTSDDNATTWTEVVQSPSVERVNSIVYRDSTYVATTTEAPYLWQSNDLTKWTKLPGYYAQGDVGRTFAVTYSEGAWHAVRDSYTLQSSRAEDLSPSSWSPDTTATALADAAYLRGREISETAPTNGQVYQWNSSTSKWTPATVSGATLPSASAAGQMLLSTGSGTSYAARARVLSGTLAERDALSPVREGDQWYVSSGSGSGTFWKRVSGAWRFRSMGPTADDVLAELGAIKAPTSPTAGHVLTYDGSVWQSAAPSAAPPSRLEDAMSGTGWSTVSATGGASASWATGPNRLLLTCDVASAGSCGVYADGYLDSGDYFDVAIRLRITGGDNSNQTRVILAVGQDTNTRANLAFFTDGSIEVGVVVGGVYTYWNVAALGALDATVRAGGQLWLRAHRSPGMLEWSYGIGVSDALPTAWSPVYSHVERMVAGQYAQARAGLTAANGRHVGVYAVTLSGVALGVRVDDIVTGLPGAFGGA